MEIIGEEQCNAIIDIKSFSFLGLIGSYVKFGCDIAGIYPEKTSYREWNGIIA